MALAFGGGVRPELGRTDYTPFLQGSVAGAQMQARGGEHIGAALANLGQIAGKAIGEYQEKKQINQFINEASEELYQKVQSNAELKRLLGNPESAKAIKVGFTAAGGGDARKGAAIYKQLEMELEKQAMQQQRESAAIRQAFTPSTMNSQAGRAAMGGASFEQLPQGLGAFLPEMQGPEEQMATLAAGGVAPNMIPGLMNASTAARRLGLEQAQLQRPQAIPQTPNEAYDAAGLSPENAKVEWRNDRYVAVPLTPKERADLEKIENEKRQAIIKGDTEKVALINQGKAAVEEINDTISLIDQAISLAEAGTGGPVAGIAPVRTLGAMATSLPGVGKLFRAAGSDYAVRQKSLYDTIRARLTFDKIGELKSLSQSGSTGLGAISNLEFTALGDSAGQVAVNLPEDMQLAYLKTMRKTLQRLAQRKADSAGGGFGPSGQIPISSEVDAALKELGL